MRLPCCTYRLHISPVEGLQSLEITIEWNRPQGPKGEHKRAGGCSYTPERGWKEMRITFHLWSYSITIYVRKIKNNRHSDK